MTENGMQPLSLRMKRASYMGTLTNTINPQRIIWHIRFPRAPKSRKMMSMNPPIKLKRLSIASVATIVNMTDELSNSIISCSYLSITSSVATLAVMANAVWDSPICLTIQSTNPKKNAVVLRMICILCKFHQDLSVWPQLSASHMLYAFWATKTYANGMNHRLDTCDTMIKALNCLETKFNRFWKVKQLFEPSQWILSWNKFSYVQGLSGNKFERSERTFGNKEMPWPKQRGGTIT